MLTLSGLVELLCLSCFIASWSCVVVSVIVIVCSFSALPKMQDFISLNLDNLRI